MKINKTRARARAQGLGSHLNTFNNFEGCLQNKLSKRKCMYTAYINGESPNILAEAHHSTPSSTLEVGRSPYLHKLH